MKKNDQTTSFYLLERFGFITRSIYMQKGRIACLLAMITFMVMTTGNVFAQDCTDTIKFESSEGFTSGTDYQLTVVSGATGKQWTTYYGTPSTTTPIEGLQSMQMRWYTPTPTNVGYTHTNYNTELLKSVSFYAKNSNLLQVKAQYSTDDGATWIGDSTYTGVSTSAQQFTYNISATGVTARVKFTMVLPATVPTATSRLYIDEVVLVHACPAVAMPVITPASGTYYSPFNCSITAAAGADIYYTTDGSTPTTTSSEYTTPFPINATTTVKAIAILGGEESSVATADYVIPSIPEYADIAAMTAVVSADDICRITGDLIFVYRSGRNIYVQDAKTNPADVRGLLIYDNTIPVITTSYIAGDTIRGGVIGKITFYNGLLEMIPLQNTNLRIVGNAILPGITTISDITADFSSYVSKLVKISTVAFEKSITYQTGTTGENVNIYSVLTPANVIQMRNNFQTLNSSVYSRDSGFVVGFVSIYGSTIQIFPRNSNDIQMNRPIALTENFSSTSLPLLWGGGTNWTFDGSTASYTGTTADTLITPNLNISGYVNTPVLEFVHTQTAGNLDVWCSNGTNNYLLASFPNPTTTTTRLITLTNPSTLFYIYFVAKGDGTDGISLDDVVVKDMATSTACADLTVANGTTTNDYVPVNGWNFDAVQKTQMIYLASGLVNIKGRTVQSLTFYSSTASVTPGKWPSVTVSIGVTSADNLSSAFATADLQDFTDVYTGLLTVAGNQMVINFSTDFIYPAAGGNLLIQFNAPVKGTYERCYFYGVTTSTVLSRLLYGSTSRAESFTPKVTFGIDCPPATCIAPTGLLAKNITPTQATACWNPVSSAVGYNLAYSNDGVNYATIYDAKNITGIDTAYQFTGLNSNSKYYIKVQTVCLGEESDWSAVATFETPRDCGSLTAVKPIIGTGTSTGYTTPFYSYNSTSYVRALSWQLFTKDELYELGAYEGAIHAIGLQYVTSASYITDLKVYMAHTSKASFSATGDSIARSDMELVYDGSFTFKNTEDWSMIPLSTPFDYNGDSNIVVVFYRPGPQPTAAQYFKYTTVSNRVIYKYAAATGTFSAYTSTSRNNVRFDMCTDVPTCLRPQSFAIDGGATATKAYSVPLYWINKSGSIAWQLKFTADGIPVDVGITTYSSIGDTVFYELTGLQPDTTYTVWLRSNCDGAGDYSDWTLSSLSFTTKKDLTDFTAFSIKTPIGSQIGATVIDAVNHTIKLTLKMDNASDITGLVMNYTAPHTTKVTVNDVIQTSGTTPNDFTNPVEYKVYAQDINVTQIWTVTVTVETCGGIKAIGNIGTTTARTAPIAFKHHLGQTLWNIRIIRDAVVDDTTYVAVDLADLSTYDYTGNDTVFVTLNFPGFNAYTTCYFSVQADCGSGDLSEWIDPYETFILPPTCHTPANLRFTDINRMGFKAEWDGGTSAPAAFDIIVSDTEVAAADRDSYADIHHVTDSSYIATGLFRDIQYYVYVRSACGGADGNSVWIEGTVTTKGLLECGNVITGTGTGTITQLPMYNTYGSCYSIQIFKKAELKSFGLGTGENINKMTIEMVTAGSTENNKKIKTVTIWLVNTDKTVFTSGTDYITSGLTKVLEPVNIPLAVGDITFNFDTPFVWDTTKNIAVVILMNETGSWMAGTFRGGETADNGSLYYKADGLITVNNGTPSGGSSITNNPSKQRANITFCESFTACPALDPAAITGTLTGTGINIATISWVAGTGDYTNGYEMICCPRAITDFSGITTTSGDTMVLNNLTSLSQLLTGLTAYTDYYIYVRVRCQGGYDDGFSDWVGGHKFKTNSQCRVPTHLSATVLSQTSAKLEWQNGSTTQDNSFSYIISESVIADPESAIPDEIDYTTTSVTLTSLTASTPYYFYIKNDCGSDGSSPWVDITFTTPDVCPQPVNFAVNDITAYAVTLNWDKGDFGTETEWSVIYFVIGSDSATTATLTTVNDINQLMLYGLSATTSYRCYLQAYCSASEQSSWTAPLNFTTLAAPVDCKTIGTGTATSGYYLPLNTYYEYSYTQQIYDNTELNNAGKIEKIKFHSASAFTHKTDVTIYLAHTTKPTFSGTSDYIAAAAFTPVWSGNFSCVAGWNEFTLATPFNYNGTDNLVIAFHDNSGAYVSSKNLYYTACTGNKSLDYYQDGSSISMSSPTSASFSYVRAYRSNIEFCFEAAPCSNVTHLTAVGITDNSARVQWYPAGTESAWRIACSTTPLDEAAAILASTTESVPYKDFPGLTEDQEYFVYVQVDCGGGVYSEWETHSFNTLALCSNPVNLVTSAITATSAIFDFDDGTYGTPYLYNYKYWIVGTIDTIPEIESHPFAVTGLSSMSYYGWQAQTMCQSTDISKWSEIKYFKTGCGTYISLPFYETYEPTSGTLDCWIKNDADGNGNQWDLTTTYAHTGTTAMISSSTVATLDNWLISPPITLTANNQLSWWVSATDATYFAEYYSVSVITTDTVVLHTETLSTNLWSQYRVDLSSYNGQTIRVAFRHVNSTNQSSLVLDDVRIETVPVCAQPYYLRLTANGTTSISFEWDVMNTVGDYQYIKADHLLTASELSSATGATPATTAAGSFSGLTPDTEYFIYVRSNCGSSTYSEWSEVLKVKTYCGTETIPFTEDLAPAGLPTCWQQQYVTKGADNANTNLTFGTSYVSFNCSSAKIGSSTRLVSTPIETTGFSDLELTFNTRHVSSPAGYTDKGIIVQYSYNNIDWFTIAEIARHSDVANDREYAYKKAEFANRPYLFIGFLFENDGSNQNTYLYANITLKEADCGKPIVQFIDNVNSNSAVLHYNTQEPNTNNQIVVSDLFTIDPASLPVTFDNVAFAGTSGTFSITGLTASTKYYVWVRRICEGGTTYSAFTKVDSLTTWEDCRAPINFAIEIVDDDDAVLTWINVTPPVMSPIVDDFNRTTIAGGPFTYSNTASAYPWMIATKLGTSCMKSSNGGVASDTSYIELTQTFTETTTFSFKYLVSSEATYDKFLFYIIDINGKELDVTASGQTATTWTQYTRSFAPGTYTFKWAYRKDVTGDYGDDCVYIDDVSGIANISQIVVMHNGADIDTIPWSETYKYEGLNAGLNCFKVKSLCREDNLSPESSETCLLINTCLMVTDLTSSHIKTDGATLTWTRGTDEVAWKININGAISEITQTDPGISYVDDVITMVLDGLLPNTAYTVGVTTKCGVTYGNNLVETSFTTHCLFDLPHSENFESYVGTTYASTTKVFPDCFDYVYEGTNTLYKPYVSNEKSQSSPNSLSIISSNTAITGDTNYVFFPYYTHPLSELHVSFYMGCNLSSTMGTLQLGYVTNDDVSTFTVLETPAMIFAMTLRNYKLNPHTSIPADARLAFRYINTSTSSYARVYIDNLNVRLIETNTDIKTYTATTAKGPATGVVDTATHTVAVQLLYGYTAGTAITPAITLEGLYATISPVTGTEIFWHLTSSDTTVNYTVTAENGTTQDWAVTFTVEACSSPTNFNAVQTSPTNVNLTWNCSITSADWDFYPSTIPMSPADLNIVASHYITFTDINDSIKTLAANTHYYLYLRTNCGSDQSVWVLKELTTWEDCQAPINLAAEIVSDTNAVLTWTNVTPPVTRIGLAVDDFNRSTIAGGPFTYANTASEYPWVIATKLGTSCMKSSNYNQHSKTSYIELTQTFTETTNFSFKYLVSSESNWDWFRFYKNGTMDFEASGATVTTWTQKTYSLAAGTYTFKWEYYKDVSNSSGDDCAYVADVYGVGVVNISKIVVMHHGADIDTIPWSETYTIEGLSAGSNCFNVKSLCRELNFSPESNEACLLINTCYMVKDLTSSNIKSDSATLTWTRGTTEEAWRININGTSFDIEQIDPRITYDADTITMVIGGLLPNTAYTVGVTTNCSGIYGNAVVETSFTTRCLLYDLPYSENFESYAGVGEYEVGVLPDCWEAIYSGSDQDYAPHIINTSSTSSPNSLAINAATGIELGTPNYVLLPEFNIGTYSYKVSFKAANAYDYPASDLYLGYINGSDPFKELANPILEIDFQTYSYQLYDSVIPAGAQLAFKFDNPDVWDDEFAIIDDVNIECEAVFKVNEIVCAGVDYTHPTYGFTISGDLLTANTTFDSTFYLGTNSFGCDSLFIVKLEVKPNDNIVISETVCEGTYTFRHGDGSSDTTVSTTGTYVRNLNYFNNPYCDSTVTLHFVSNPAYSGIVEIDTICNGQNYRFYGSLFDTTLTTSVTGLMRNLGTNEGCDSIVTLDLYVLNATLDTLKDNICSNQLPYSWDPYSSGTPHLISTAGYHKDSIMNVSGCFDYKILHLTIYPAYIQDETLTICSYELPYVWRGITFPIGTISQTIPYNKISVNGCDSIVNLELTINNAPITDDGAVTICSNELPYTWRGQDFYTSGIKQVVDGSYSNGCDSVFTVNLTVNESPYIFVTANKTAICSGDNVTFNAMADVHQENFYAASLGNDSTNQASGTPLTTSDISGYTTLTNIYQAGGAVQIGNSTAVGTIQTTDLDLSKPFKVVLGTKGWLGTNANLDVYVAGDMTTKQTVISPSFATWGPGGFTETVLSFGAATATSQLVLTTQSIGTVKRGFIDYIYIITTVDDGSVTYNWVGQSNTTPTLTVSPSVTTTYKLVASKGTCYSDTIEKTINVSTSYLFEYYDTICPINTYANHGFTANITGKIGDTTFVNHQFTVVGNCDSIHKLYLHINPRYLTALDTTYASICSGESYTWQGTAYNTAGIHKKTLSTIHGCDSVVALNLTVNPLPEVYISAPDESCMHDYFTAHIINNNPIFEEPFTGLSGNSTSSTGSNAKFEGNTNFPTDSATYQAGDAVRIGKSAAIGFITSKTIDLSAPSVVTFQLKGWGATTPKPTKVVVQVDGNAIDTLLTDLNLNWAGGFVEKTVNLPASTATSTLTFATVDAGSSYDKRCFIDVIYIKTVSDTIWTYSWNTGATTPTISVLTNSSLMNLSCAVTDNLGCTTTVTKNVIGNNVDSTSFSIVECDSYVWDTTTYKFSGAYYHTYTNLAGCDSVVRLDLTIKNSVTHEFTADSCDQYTWNGTVYTTSGDYVKNFTAANGCDSTVTLHLTINNSKTHEFTVTACDSYTWNGIDYTASGDKVQNFTTVNGCDSVVTLHLTVNYSDTSSFTADSCDQYTWNGVVYTTSGDYDQTLSTVNGCDSVVTLHLTVNYSDTSSFTADSCDQYTWNGTVYTTSGDYDQTLSTVNGCDSVVTLHLTIYNSVTNEFTVAACDSYTWNTETYTASGDKVQTLSTVNGCDSVVTLHLTINATPIVPTATTTDNTLCLGAGDGTITVTAPLGSEYEYSIDGAIYQSSVLFDALQDGDYELSVRLVGTTCVNSDSVTVGTTVVRPIATATNNGPLCIGETLNLTGGYDSSVYTYSWTGPNGFTSTLMSPTISNVALVNAGTYTITVTDPTTLCDNTRSTVVVINSPVTHAFTADSCDQYTWNGTVYTTSGNYVKTLSTVNGCDSVVTLHLTINTSVTNDFSATACDSYTWNGIAYTTSGDYEQTLSTINGCDSVVTLHLTINTSFTNEFSETACDSYTWNGIDYTASGDKVQNFTTVNGCDSVVTLHLTINNSDTSEFTVAACDSYTWNGIDYTASGDYDQTLSTVNGCDSVVTLHLTINTSVTNDFSATACDSYTWNGIAYTTSGDKEQTLSTVNGCDSVVTLHLTINTSFTNEFSATACDSYIWNGIDYTASGDYLQTLSSTVNGCDSVVTLHLTINNSDTSEVTVAACDSYTWNGIDYTTSGDYDQTLSTVNGCDSVVTLHLTINTSVTNDFSATECDSYTWNGIDYTASGDYDQTLSTVNGCDSVVTLHLTINTSFTNDFSATACDSYTWNTETYTTSGDKVQNFTAENGCDSTVTLHLTINNSKTHEFTVTACGNYTWNGIDYPTSGNYDQILSTVNGCDSVVTLHLTINAIPIVPTATTTENTVCSGAGDGTITVTAPLGSEYEYSIGGIYQSSVLFDALQDGDYVLSVRLVGTTCVNSDNVTVGTTVVRPVATATNNGPLCTGETLNLTGGYDSSVYTYSWIGPNGFTSDLMSPTITNVALAAAGTYTITVTDPATLCDNTRSTVVVINSTATHEFTVTACDSYTWNTETYTTSGNYVKTLSTVNGCDSVVTLHLTIYNSETQEFTVTACDGYTWNGIPYTTSGDYDQTLSTVNGCDSVVTLHLTINNSTTNEFSAIACDSYTWNAETYTTSGDKVQNFTAANGCDSVVTLHLTINATPIVPTATTTDNTVYSGTGNGTITVTAPLGSEYEYSIGGIYQSSVLFDALQDGNYVLTVRFVGTTCVNSDNVTVGTTVVCPTAIATNNGPLCIGETLNLTGGYDSSLYTYSWIGPNGFTSDLMSPTITNVALTAAGTYTITVTDPTTLCDNIQSTVVVINSTATHEFTVTACDSYTWNTETYTTSGNYVKTLSTVNGCDSVVTLHLTIYNSETHEFTVTACDSYTWNTETYTTSGDKLQNFTTVNGCDSVVTLHLTINNTVIATPDTYTICEGSTQTWHGNSYSITGTYYDTLNTIVGCDSICTLILTVNPLPVVTISGDLVICAGETTVLSAPSGYTYLWNTSATTQSIDVTTAGEYSVTVTDANGCVNSALVTVTVNPLPVVTISGGLVICYGETTTLTAPSGYTYLWNTSATTQSIDVITAGDYSVTVTDANGCVNSALVTVTVNPLPVVTISGDLVICAGETTVLTASAGSSYLWNTSATTQSIDVTTAGEYSVTVTDANGCVNSALVTVTVNPLPVVTILGDLVICAGETTVLSAPSGYTYLWNTGATTQSIDVTTADDYSVIVTDVNGCVNSALVTVVVNPLPVVTISGGLVICAGETTILTASAGSSYLWNTGATTQSIDVTTAGGYSVTVTDANGCSNSALVTVTVNPLPIVTISGGLVICEGATTTLTASVGSSYLWNTGATTRSIDVTTSGEYTVTVTNANGCSNSAFVTVTVNPLPVVTISGDLVICAGESTLLTASAGISYLWNTGAATRSINVTIAGEYSVTVTNANGCVNSALVTVVVNPLPVVTISGDLVICAGETTTLTASAGSSYLWNTGATTQSINVTTAGGYSVTVTDANGCSNSALVTVTVNPLPTVTINGNTSFCEGSSTILSAPSGYTYLWNTGATTQFITVTTAGDYSVTVTNTNGCSNTATVNVIVHALPIVTISGETVICQNESTVLTASAGASYYWSTGATTQSITVSNAGTYFVSVSNENGCYATAYATITHNPTYHNYYNAAVCQGIQYVGFGFTIETPTPGLFTYENHLQTINGCDSISTLSLLVYATPVIEIVGDLDICQGEMTLLTAHPINGLGYTYLWSTGATTASIYVSPNETQTYGVTVTTSTGCSSSESVTVVVHQTPTVTINGNTLICKGESTTLTVTGGGSDLTYLWSTGETTASITVSPLYTIFYSVVVTNSYGCSSYLEKTVSIQATEAPRALYAYSNGNSIGLTWYGDADNYIIYRNDEWLANTNSIGYIDEYIVFNERYCYYVIGVYGPGQCESDPSNTSCATAASTIEIEQNSYKVYPNPTDNFVTVEGEDMKSIDIYNSLGQKVESKVLRDQSLNSVYFETGNFETGMYIIRIQTNNGAIVNKRLIIVR